MWPSLAGAAVPLGERSSAQALAAGLVGQFPAGYLVAPAFPSIPLFLLRFQFQLPEPALSLSCQAGSVSCRLA